MADDETAKKDISDILTLVNRKFEIIDAIWSNNNKYFETKFRTQIERDNEDYNKLCDEWVDLFSEYTNTVWVKKTSNTGPKIKFRKQYQCWTGDGKMVQKDQLFDPRRCKGVIDMKVLTDNPLTRRKNKHIRKGLNVVVKVNFNHLHSVDISNHFSFFVNGCKPLKEVPKTIIQPNTKLPKLVEEMIQKGHITSQKAAQRAAEKLKERYEGHKLLPDRVPDKTGQEFGKEDDTMPQTDNNATLQILQTSNSTENVESVKLELRQPTYTQLVVSTPQQIDNIISDQFLSCQPIMFDMSHLVPITSQSQFIHVQSNQNMNESSVNQLGQYL